jgi:23S rRNA (cytosine1962-C5)-methyltransferase
MLPSVAVSRTTARFLEQGHPWVRPDRFTDGLAALRCGQAATLVDHQGRRLASALVEPGGAICARVFHRLPDRAFDPAQALRRAWTRRAALHGDPATDCYRIVHGEGDHLPGLRVERYAGVLVVVAFAACIAPWLDAIVAVLRDLSPGSAIVVKQHAEDLRRREVATAVRWAPPGVQLSADRVVIGSELGVRYPLTPAGGLATGLYVDQRATRAWLRSRCAGARILNLFAYTGAFSLCGLAAGAVHACAVDLSAPALARASEAAELNGVADRHRTVRLDCGRFLGESAETWDLIVCDPPTAAHGGDGWVLRRDYPALLAKAAARLAPGGVLVACCNTLHGKPFDLGEAVRASGLTALAGPSLGEDLPQLQGFPEGRPFRLVAARRP